MTSLSSRRVSRVAAALAGIAVSALALTACAGGSGDAAEPAADSTDAAAEGYGDLTLQLFELSDQLDDPLDSGEVDAVVLGEPLDLPEPLDVVQGVPATAATGPLRGDQPEAVVGTEGLRMHARQLGGGRDQKGGRIVGPRSGSVVLTHDAFTAPSPPADRIRSPSPPRRTT